MSADTFPRYPYVCDTCGKIGVPDDGIDGIGDECPDEDCDGTIESNGPAPSTDALTERQATERGWSAYWQPGMTVGDCIRAMRAARTEDEPEPEPHRHDWWTTGGAWRCDCGATEPRTIGPGV